MSARFLRLRLATVLAAALLAPGCSWLSEKADETRDWSAAKLYSEAKEALNNGDYARAIGYYDKLQARYPFGRYAQQAQLESVYAYYRDGEPDSAVAAADRFIKTYPRHPYVDYVYYLKGLTNYNRASGPLDRLMPPDPTRTDASAALQSFTDFNDLVTKFPDSRYAPDARARMLFLRNNLASYELNVARHYQSRGVYVAAVNRAKYVLETYARTPASADALSIMTQAYVKMNMPQLAADSLRVMERNYPQSPELPKLNALVKGAG